MIRKASILFIIFVLASISFFFFSKREIDPDLWGHLKFGQDIYQRGEVARQDFYSYSSPGARWINHEWLSELIFFTIFKLTKGTGLIIFKVILGFIITILIFVSLSNQTKSTFLKALFMLISLSVINHGFSIRPQLFTYLLFTIFVLFINRFEETSKRGWLYPFPFIALLWCNLHGGFIAGIGILLFYFLFKLFKKEFTKGLIIVTALTIFVTLANPNGKELWTFLFRSLAKPRPHIFEWQRVRFSFLYLDYFVLLFLTIIGVLFSKSKRSYYEIGALFISFFYSFQHCRHVVLFAILAAMYIPKHIDSFTRDYLMRLEERFSGKLSILIFLSLSLLSISIWPYRGEGGRFKIRIPETIYPLEAIAFMKDNNISGNIFSFFNWAQLCIKELSDKSRVFFDGRYRTVYSDDLIRDYFEVLYGEKDYKDYLHLFPETDIMFLHRFNPLTHRLLEDKDWVLVYSSCIAWIFLKNNKTNSKIIENFKNNKLIRNQKRPSFYL